MSAAKSLLLFSALLASQALAADGQSQTYQVCMDRSGGVTSKMLACADAEINRHDATLNQNYQAAMQTLEEPQQQGLRAAQRAWIKFRDAECGFIAGLTGGSIDRINAANCMLEMTQQRANVLADLVKLYLGD